jgi:hypothetical protein
MHEAEQLFPEDIRCFKADPAANPMACYRTVFPAVDNDAIIAIRFEREKRLSPAIKLSAWFDRRTTDLTSQSNVMNT